MHTDGLLAQTRRFLQTNLNGYLQIPELQDQLETFLSEPGLGEHSGLLGAMALGMDALKARSQH